MSLSIRPLHRVFAAEVIGIDCRRALDPETVMMIEGAMDEYAVLVFPEQELSDAEQIAFTRHFGELEGYNTPGHIRRRGDSRLGRRHRRFLEPGQNRRADVDRGSRLVFQACRPVVALRQLVPSGAGQIFIIIGPGLAVVGRQHRVRRYARRL